MQHQDAGNLAVPTEMGGHRHVELGRIDIRELVETQGGLVTVNSFGHLVPIPRPKRPLHQVGMFGQREQGQPVYPPMFPDPVPDLHVVRMGVLGEAGSLRLLRREEALLGLGNLEEAPLCGSMKPRHDTILQTILRSMQVRARGSASVSWFLSPAHPAIN